MFFLANFFKSLASLRNVVMGYTTQTEEEKVAWTFSGNLIWREVNSYSKRQQQKVLCSSHTGWSLSVDCQWLSVAGVATKLWKEPSSQERQCHAQPWHRSLRSFPSSKHQGWKNDPVSGNPCRVKAGDPSPDMLPCKDFLSLCWTTWGQAGNRRISG